mmetsp:Transcript_30905/g.52313  ORF Transcript_30905/g.52313 Transcript_30905/m.52313 type:complete len:214 (-) Transcript_30905:412-1053(-)
MGIKVPILPGIMPFFKPGSFGRMTGFCKTVVPDDIQKAVVKYKDDEKGFQAWGVEHISKICRNLLTSGVVPSIHLYTLNNEKIPYQILDTLGFPKSRGSSPPQLDKLFSLAINSKVPDKGWRAGLEKSEGKSVAKKQAPKAKDLISKAKTLAKTETKVAETISSHTKLMSAVKSPKSRKLSNTSSHLSRAEDQTKRATIAAYKAEKREQKANA